MKLEFDREQLLLLMQDFYTMSGIRMVLFDDEYRELLSYPAHHCSFCRHMKANTPTRKLCAASDEYSFRQSALSRKSVVYRCHAGLIEATTPLVANQIIIGYLMFGQISDQGSETLLAEQLRGKLQSYDMAADFDVTQGIPLKNSQQIQAATKIMEACTLYAILNQTVSLRREHFTATLRNYLLASLNQPLTSHTIAKGLGISRSKLYQQCQEYLGIGIGEYLRGLRIEQAQTLLKETDRSITQIASDVGFEDYNYFCRVFRQETGCSAKAYRSTALGHNRPPTDQCH